MRKEARGVGVAGARLGLRSGPHYKETAQMREDRVNVGNTGDVESVPYEAPQLVELGSFADLTLGGTTGPGEGLGAGDSGVCC
jgi:outer membrane lipoprotein SlyB